MIIRRCPRRCRAFWPGAPPWPWMESAAAPVGRAGGAGGRAVRGRDVPAGARVSDGTRSWPCPRGAHPQLGGDFVGAHRDLAVAAPVALHARQQQVTELVLSRARRTRPGATRCYASCHQDRQGRRAAGAAGRAARLTGSESGAATAVTPVSVPIRISLPDSVGVRSPAACLPAGSRARLRRSRDSPTEHAGSRRRREQRAAAEHGRPRDPARAVPPDAQLAACVFMAIRRRGTARRPSCPALRFAERHAQRSPRIRPLTPPRRPVSSR